MREFPRERLMAMIIMRITRRTVIQIRCERCWAMVDGNTSGVDFVGDADGK